MLAIILALMLGIGAGFFNLLPVGFYKVIDKLMVVILFVLIFNLAVGVGSDETIFNHLSTIGVASLALAVGAIVGSVVLVYLVQQKWFREER